MTYRGTVQKGVVVLDEQGKLPDGAKVEVSLLETSVEPSVVRPPDANATPSLLEQLKDLAGTVQGLPTDIAENHDHYLYGTRKR